MNFQAIIPKIVSKGDTDTLVMESGNIEITNLDVNKAMMDPEKDIREYHKEWFQMAEEVSTNLYKVAEDAIAADLNLNVILVKRLPRFDRSANDILGIKHKLSEFANQV